MSMHLNKRKRLFGKSKIRNLITIFRVVRIKNKVQTIKDTKGYSLDENCSKTCCDVIFCEVGLRS